MPNVGMLKMSLRGGPELVSALKRKGPRIIQVLASKMTALMYQLSSYIVSRKLSGQVLHRRSGVLSGSVRTVPASISAHKITAGVEAGSGPAGLYAGVHEFGGLHAYAITSVKARALRFMVDGKYVFARSVMHKAADARPYMAPSLEENKGDIQVQLQEALERAIAEE